MATNNGAEPIQFKHFNEFNSFLTLLNSGQILNSSIVFIQDVKLIWTHGQYYGNFNEILDKFTEIETIISDNEKVTAAALVDLSENKADRATTIEGYGITDLKIENGIITIGKNTITVSDSEDEVIDGGYSIN